MTEPPPVDAHALETREIEQAAERLLNGTAYRSSGRLSIVALAAEANVKRTRLYEAHRGLVDTFNQRTGKTTSQPSVLAMQGQLRAAQAMVTELQAERDRQGAIIRTLMATVTELSLELDGSTNVLPIRRSP